MAVTINKGIDYVKDIIHHWYGETINQKKCFFCTGNIIKCNYRSRYWNNLSGHVHVEEENNIYQCNGTNCNDCRLPICYRCCNKCKYCDRFLCPKCIKYVYIEYDDFVNDEENEENEENNIVINRTDFVSQCSRKCLYPERHLASSNE